MTTRDEKPAAATEPPSRTIVVTGDLIIDANISHARHDARRKGAVFDPRDRTRIAEQNGGAALLAEVVEALVETSGAPYTVARPPSPVDIAQTNGRARYPYSYAIWKQHARDIDGKKENTNRVWRVAEFLGHSRSAVDSSTVDLAAFRLDPDVDQASLIILDDAGIGFRKSEAIWPVALRTKGPRVVLKMSHPIARDPLWERLIEIHRDNLIVVISANDVRRSEVHVSRQLSWERTAEELAIEIEMNPRVNALADCWLTVVSFGPSGAFVRSADRTTLIFDPEHIEGSWETRHPGGMIGYLTALTGAIVRQLMDEPSRDATYDALVAATRAGLWTMRRLHENGYQVADGQGSLGDGEVPTVELRAKQLSTWIHEGLDNVVREPAANSQVATTPGSLPRATAVPVRNASGRPWAIAESSDPGILSEAIVRRGPVEGLAGLPVGRFGNLLTVDRRETEALRSIQGLMEEYCMQSRPQPLSVAVFGSPGAGKSFAVREIAKTIAEREFTALTFNLSQLSSFAELAGAFHQVRDVVLRGEIPLVFWDEFDSALDGDDNGWLRHFLAPMQDGTFQDCQVTHPIGRSIFVFAGGKSTTLNAFTNPEDKSIFKDAKGPTSSAAFVAT
jgi:hypothetical protein